MKATGLGGMMLGLGLLMGPICAHTANGQVAPAAAPGSTATGAASSGATTSGPATVRRRHRHRTAQGDQVIPRESQGTGTPTPDETTAQRAADQRLLQQQQAQSAQAAAITNQVVQQAQKQQQQIQREVRIQDAPGPAQTGVVPAAGPPAAPVNSDDRIQDAPGPAQTIPQPVTPPATQSAPAQQPATPPQN